MSEAEQLSCVMNELAEIKKLLAEVILARSSNDDADKSNLPPSGKEYLTVDEAAALIGSKRSYIYRLTHEKRISFTKPGGNRVLIRRADLVEWVESNRVKSQGEVNEDVERFLKTPRRPTRNLSKR